MHWRASGRFERGGAWCGTGLRLITEADVRGGVRGRGGGGGGGGDVEGVGDAQY
jgi:hypothetical protein